MPVIYRDSLNKWELQAGDRVCFSAISKPEMVAAYLAIQMCGAVAVFLDKNALPENMFAIYEEAEAKLLLTDKPMKEFEERCNITSLRVLYMDDSNEKHERICPSENAVAEILFTTGTTGRPKGVIHTYKSVFNILNNTIAGIHISEEDVLLLPLPLNHSFALRVLRAILYQGGSLILQNGFTFAREVENNITSFGCNAMACVPASYEVLKGQMQNSFSRVLGGLQYIEFGAGSLTIGQRREITNKIPGVKIWNTWGSSETGGAIFCDVSEVVKNESTIGSLGRPLAGKVEVRILDKEGNPLESGRLHPGRLQVKGDMVMAGYWKNSEATASAIVDGWLTTGDMAYIEEENVFILGRADDIINVGGEKVSPIEVENIASTYPDIVECACIGEEDPDGTLGQIPVLFVVAKSGYSEDSLKKYLSTRMERYKLPQKFVLLEKIPRNRMQKVDRQKLRGLIQGGNTASLINPVVDNILSRRSIRKFIEKEIPHEILSMILRCGYHAPSGHNMQSWRFTVITDRNEIEKLKTAVNQAAEQNGVYCYGWDNPQVLILVSNDSRNANGCQDASCAAENMMLAARSYGIGSVWLNPLVTLRDKEPVKVLLDNYGIPQTHTIWSTVAMGYAENEGTPLQKNEKVIHFVNEVCLA